MNKSRSILRFPVLVFLFVFFIPASIFGQNYQTFRSEIDQITQQSRWRIGPFYLRPTILLNLEYDGNIYGISQAGNPISDYVAAISPQVSSYLLIRKWLILSFSENPQYLYFAKTKNERTFNNSYSPAFRLLLLNRFVLSGGYQFRRAKARTLSELDRLILEQSKGYNASLFFDTTRNTSLGFSGSIMQISYENITLPETEIPLSRSLDREMRSAEMQFYYQIFSEISYFLNVGYTEFEFNDLQAIFRDSYSYHVYTGIRFPVLGRVRGTLSLGYNKFIPREKGFKAFSGFIADTGLDFRVGRFSFRLQFSRAIPFSLGTNIFFVEDRIGGGISFYLTQFVRLDYNIAYGKNNYPEKEKILMPDGNYIEIERRDIYQTHSAGIVFRIFRNTGIGLRANYSERRSNFGLQDMERLSVGLSVIYDF